MILKHFALSTYPGLLAMICALVLMAPVNVYGQDKTVEQGPADTQECPDPAPQTSATHSFRRIGETIEIPVNVADCQVVALELRWSNGRNNGSNFSVTFLDTHNRPISSKPISAFMIGSIEFPFSEFYSQPYFGSRALISVPSMVIIQAVSPFAYPANLTYTVTRVGRRLRPKPAAPRRRHDKEESADYAEGKTSGSP